MNLIYISDKNGIIGNDDNLVFNIEEDLKNFKNLTTGHNKPSVLITGYNTYLKLPIKKILLNNRILWILTNKNYENTEHIKFFTYDDLIESYKLNHNNYNWWIIGGKQIYELFEPLAYNIFHTVVDVELICNKPVIYNHKNYFLINKTDFYYDIYDKKTNRRYDIKIVHYVNKFNYTDYIIDNNEKNNNEYQYLNILYKTLCSTKRMTRNGYTYSYFGDQIRFDLTKGFPLLTTKKMFFKGIVHELLFFIKGLTNSKELEKYGVNIWKGNTSRKFLDGLGFNNYIEGEMGPMYGYQWRKFNNHIDQLNNLLNEISNNPTSRRLLMTTFNPEQVNQGVLYPCHSLITQFYIDEDNYISVNMYQRSADVFLGLPFNIASTSLLLEIICHYLSNKTGKKYKAKDVIISLGDVHLYENHKDQAIEQLKRKPLTMCKLNILNNYENIDEYQYSDFNLIDYKSYQLIMADMVA